MKNDVDSTRDCKLPYPASVIVALNELVDAADAMLETHRLEVIADSELDDEIDDRIMAAFVEQDKFLSALAKARELVRGDIVENSLKKSIREDVV